ncbi:hypothetical protein NPX13_g2517 [Xylaria arbuscula]|uniref:Uncharacterized protein n=1 Tax=Xylaria arbuscula TaxID=114810 RepID=A0A9W8TP37_9PEZI|nr:hypothetical protein NPX13_g2517 [Xylaria arbuscula]
MASSRLQIQVSTTLPSFEYLPLPVPQSRHDYYPFYRLLVRDDLEAYTSFLKEDLVTHGHCNPKFDLKRQPDPLQRILENPVSQGIHLIFFIEGELGIEIAAEGGVYIPDKDGLQYTG